MNEYRDEALSKLDVLAFFGRYVGQLKRLNDQEYKFLCPFHDDKVPSANVNVNTTAWFCHACGAKGSVLDLVMKRDNIEYKEALAIVGEAAGMPPPTLDRKGNGQAGPAVPSAKAAGVKLTEEMVKGWHEAALRNADLMRWFTEHRGYTVETVDKYQLGWDGTRVTIPIRDAAGKLVNVRRYLRDSKGSQGKMLGFAPGFNEARLFPIDALSDAEIILVEGEWDAMLLRQYGFNAMSVTSGAGIFNNEWVELFSDKQVTICYDNDKAGQDGAIAVATKLSTNLLATVLIAQIPGLPEKGDVTDFFVEQARSVEELTTLFMDAAPFIVAPAAEQTTPTKVPLADASNAKWRDTLLAISVLMSGKAMTPFTVPFDWTTKCDMSNKRLCGVCPMKLKSGVSRTTLSARDPRVLELINVTTVSQQSAMRKMAGAVEQCNRGVNTVHASTNIEELRVIPEIDTSQNAADSEHVSRTAYFIGHGLRSNQGYEMRGYTHPLPKTQATVHVFSDAIPAQDNIATFVMTPEVRDRLHVFAANGNVEERMRAIYDDLRINLHRIQGRFDMQVAYDLVWHSVIAFTFNGSYVRRGWTECMVIGDSGQGKTEMAMELLRHYRMGERVQGEQASLAGLIGGLEKMADTWMLGWGKVPQNDKRLLVVDETQGLQAGQIEAMSDVRATGVAEITKIRTERTNARCRLVWLANPVSGIPLTAHNQGVLAIKELFKKPEDIRRLDFAITVASGDVALSEINAAHGAPGTPVYTSDACRELILWAWSRRPDQIVFTPEATKAILAAATKMGGDYSSAIPLVEPADQRIKLARLAAACAARVFSTDESNERVVIKPEHVEFVVTYLNRIYSAASMAYDEYSGQAKQGEVLSEDDEAKVRGAIEGWTNSAEAQLFFRQARIFKKSELVDTLGWDEPYTKAQLRFLTSNRLIRPTREGHVKTPVYIQLLRSMHTGVRMADVPSEDEAPF